MDRRKARRLKFCKKVREITNLPVASHLTCVDATVEQLEEYLAEAKATGDRLHRRPCAVIRPKVPRMFDAIEGGLRYANELVELIRAKFYVTSESRLPVIQKSTRKHPMHKPTSII